MMRLTTAFGDHLKLQAISKFLFVRIHVVSSQGPNYDRVIVPREDIEEIPTITIGYHPDGNEEHNICISEDVDFFGWQ